MDFYFLFLQAFGKIFIRFSYYLNVSTEEKYSCIVSYIDACNRSLILTQANPNAKNEILTFPHYNSHENHLHTICNQHDFRGTAAVERENPERGTGATIKTLIGGTETGVGRARLANVGTLSVIMSIQEEDQSNVWQRASSIDDSGLNLELTNSLLSSRFKWKSKTNF